MHGSTRAMWLRGLHILIAEDEEASREIGQIMLSRLEARVDIAADGEQALEKMRTECPELVLCDLIMPNMDGLELAHRVRRLPTCAHVRLVAVTGRTDDATYWQAWAAGYDAHIEKPLTLQKLHAIVRRLVFGYRM